MSKPTIRLLQLKSNSKMEIRLFWLSFTAQMEILVLGYLGLLMHSQSKLFFSGTLTQIISNLDVSKPNKSGQMLVNIAKYLKLFYLNQLGPNRHMRDDPVHGTSDILDVAFISPALSSRDISFSIADDHMSSDHFPIQISLDKPLKWNTPLSEPHYGFDKTNDDLLHNTLKDSLTNIDTNITT